MFSVEEDSRDPFNDDDDLPGFHSNDTAVEENEESDQDDKE
jgi:hypothetical protein